MTVDCVLRVRWPHRKARVSKRMRSRHYRRIHTFNKRWCDAGYPPGGGRMELLK